MTRLLWTTDVHLNFVAEPALRSWEAELRELEPDVVLLSGDIAESSDVIPWLNRLANCLEDLGTRWLFVLGNHDYYRGSIARTRSDVEELCDRRDGLVFLTAVEEPVLLGSDTAVIGHDGWADGRAGDFFGSWVMMNDYGLIEELVARDKRERLQRLRQWGDEAAAAVERRLRRALSMRRNVVLVTHVPPMRAACWYEGRLSDDEWAPHFVCEAMGASVLRVMREHRDSRLLVLCGHTHGGGETRPLHNVRILTGAATYGSPRVNHCWEVA